MEERGDYMRRGTERDLVIEIEDYSDEKILRVDLKQKDKLLILTDFTIEASILKAPITQEQINEFNKGLINIQLRYVNTKGKVDATDIITTFIEDVLEDEVLSNED